MYLLQSLSKKNVTWKIIEIEMRTGITDESYK